MRVLLALLLVMSLSGCAIDDYGYDDYRTRDDECWEGHAYHYEYVEGYYPTEDEHCEPDGFYTDFYR